MASLSGKKLSELRSQAQQLDAHLQMGKAGMSDAFLDELRSRLDDERLVKVRLLPSSQVGAGRKELSEQLAEATDTVLVEVRGNTCVLYRV